MVIKILDNEVEIRFIPEHDWGHDSYGDFSDDGLTIRIRTGLKNDLFLNTLCHELTHVKQFLFGRDLSEEEANRDALFWASFLQNSPVIKKLIQEYKEYG